MRRPAIVLLLSLLTAVALSSCAEDQVKSEVPAWGLAEKWRERCAVEATRQYLRSKNMLNERFSYMFFPSYRPGRWTVNVAIIVDYEENKRPLVSNHGFVFLDEDGKVLGFMRGE